MNNLTLSPQFADSDFETLAFFYYTENRKLIFEDSKFFEFLETSGFGIVQTDETVQMVRIDKNIVSKVISTDIKRYVIDYLKNNESEEVQNYVLKNTKIFSPNYLDGLKLIVPKIIRDTKSSVFLCYRNGVVEITASEIKDPIPYENLDFQVWSHQIIDREFKKDVDISTRLPVFCDFLIKLSNNEQDRYNYIATIIGYALHNYRTGANTRAIIFNDEIVNENPEGGSGKSLLAIALKNFRNLVVKDGKSFNPKKSFSWSDINESVDLVLIDDVGKEFSFEDLFSVITLGIPVEKKYMDGIFLPIEKSPLIIIATNKILPGYSGSYKRRQYNVDIHQYFSANWKPEDEYGHIFFLDWDLVEWAKFDFIIVNFIQFYLQNGVLVPSETDQRKKDAIRATNSVFVEWVEEIISEINGVFTSTTILHDRFLEETGQSKREYSSKRFVGSIKKYCEIYRYDFIEDRNQYVRGFRIIIN